MYWTISPYHNADADSCVLPAATEVDHRKALAYAQRRLEEVWDNLEPGQTATVQISLCDGPLPDLDTHD